MSLPNSFQHIAKLSSDYEVQPDEVVTIGVNQVLHILDQPSYWWVALVSMIALLSLINIGIGYSRHKKMEVNTSPHQKTLARG